MALFELPLDLPIRKMSKGMKQKVGIVAAFMFSPRILILDEPTSGLDPLMQNRFVDLVEEEKRRGCAILLSSHIFDEVQRTADRIGIIRAGHMVAVDTAAALRERHMRHYTVTLASPEEAAAFSRDFGGSSEGCTATVSASQNLERIFLDYYKEQR
ncbi:MAG: AAA family ATPase [Collinsella sp.]|nr:AAA family ATPase [Collinsella sp.]